MTDYETSSALEDRNHPIQKFLDTFKKQKAETRRAAIQEWVGDVQNLVPIPITGKLLTSLNVPETLARIVAWHCLPNDCIREESNSNTGKAKEQHDVAREFLWACVSPHVLTDPCLKVCATLVKSALNPSDRQLLGRWVGACLTNDVYFAEVSIHRMIKEYNIVGLFGESIPLSWQRLEQVAIGNMWSEDSIGVIQDRLESLLALIARERLGETLQDFRRYSSWYHSKHRVAMLKQIAAQQAFLRFEHNLLS